MTLTTAVGAQTLDEQKAQAQKQVGQLQAKLESSVERYNYACVKIEQTRGLIEENTANLTAAEQKLAADRVRLNNRVRAMYVTRQYRFVDVVVNASNFDSFLVGLDLAKKIGEQDAELVKQVKSAKTQLEGVRSSLQEQKDEQEAARKEMGDAKAAVESDLAGAKGTLAGVDSQIQAALAQRAAEAASNKINYVATTRRAIPSPIARTRPPGAPHGGAVGVAYDQLGKPYVWGAAGPDSFDCSGLTMYCYQVGAGISITHSSYDQANCGTPVSIGELQPGDILGFRGWGHVGLYVGGDSFIEAPCTGEVVKVSSLSARTDFCGAVRP